MADIINFSRPNVISWDGLLCDPYPHYVAAPMFSVSGKNWMQINLKAKRTNFRFDFLRQKKTLLLKLCRHRSQESKTIKFCRVKKK
jgi:hypothetical protein